MLEKYGTNIKIVVLDKFTYAGNKDSKELKEKYDKVIDEMLKDGTVAKLKEY